MTETEREEVVGEAILQQVEARFFAARGEQRYAAQSSALARALLFALIHQESGQ